MNKILHLISSKFILRIKRFVNRTFKEDELRKISVQKEAEIEKLRLKNLPRYTQTEVDFLNKRIQIVDIASFNFMKKEIFDQQIYKFKATSEAPYIIDCGANIGLSIIYFKQLYPKAEIIGFEPDNKVFDVLQYNMDVFQFSDVKLYKKACWNTETILKFYSEGADAGRFANENDTQSIIEVETLRLRRFLNKKVYFLKIDIEGAELVLLEDCKDLLHNVENIFVEYHSFVNEEQELDKLLSILTNAGFRYLIQQHGVVSKNPFLNADLQMGMDILLNISGYRALKI